MRVASFDIGFRNFAFCVEEFAFQALSLQKDIVYTAEGTLHPPSLLHPLYQQGRVVRLALEHFELDGSACFQPLTRLLDGYSDLWDTVDVFLVEAQIAFGRNANVKALRISQHVLSYFSVIYGPFKTVLEFSSTYKTRLLGCPLAKRKKKRDRKLFSVNLCHEILTMKNCPETLQTFLNLKKKDDVADCVLMIQAFKVLMKKNNL